MPGDVSSAAVWLVLGAIHPDARIRLRNVGVNLGRIGIVHVLKSMGAGVTMDEQGVQPGPSPSLTSPSRAAVLPASLSEARSYRTSLMRFRLSPSQLRRQREKRRSGTPPRFRVKESDRISTTVGELRKLGARYRGAARRDDRQRPDGATRVRTARVTATTGSQ